MYNRCIGTNTTLTILGAGYVGLTTAALLAHAGYKVYVLEPNKERLEVIKQGRSFFYEAGLDVVIQTAIDAGNLIPTDSYAESIPKSQVVFSCVGTPDNPDGSSNLSYVFAAAEETAKYIAADTIYVQKSTVPVGTGREVMARSKKFSKDIPYVSNPEFLRESTALSDTLYFDRVVVGGDDKTAVDTVLDIYRTLETKRDTIAALAGVVHIEVSGAYIATNLNSAELIKVTSNAFLALKISFANSIAKLADQVGADVSEVMDAVGADTRIGRAFLNAGRGYGGGCFPKDVSGLLVSGLAHGVELEIMQSAQTVNDSMPGYIIEKLQTELGKNTDGVTIAILGLAFKSGTSDARRSPGVKLANLLVQFGASIKAYDPQAMHEAQHALHNTVVLTKSTDEALDGADAVIVATDWPEFDAITPDEYATHLGGKLFIDAMNHFDRSSIEAAGLTYLGIGR